MKDGRPLRFLGSALGGWVLFRIAMLWPGAEAGSVQTLIRTILPPASARAFTRPVTGAPVEPWTEHKLIAVADHAAWPSPPEHVLPIAIADAGPRPRRYLSQPPIIGPIGPLHPPSTTSGVSRLAGSAWLLARGGPSGTLSGGQLGGSQAGVRLTYAIGHARRIAIAARLATPLAGRGKEAAIGLDWKPTHLPFHLVAEQRFVLDGGKGGPTVGVIGGFGPGTVAPGLRIEAYGQAGAIARDGIEGFVDAAARATHPLVVRGPVRVDIGAGLWGSAQKGAARLDLGPTLSAAIPIGRRSVRLSVDWRERVAGEARPGSGPAFTVGSDF